MSLIFKLDFRKKAKSDLKKHIKANDKNNLRKIDLLNMEIIHNPYKGLGHPERLKGNKWRWSRRINHCHRLVYEVDETNRVIRILSLWGHYDDK